MGIVLSAAALEDKTKEKLTAISKPVRTIRVPLTNLEVTVLYFLRDIFPNYNLIKA